MKMYVLVKDGVDLGMAVVGIAHAPLACYLKFQASPEIQEWLSGPFNKTVCRVTDEEFERAKQVDDHVVITESRLEGKETTLAFKPRAEWPKHFKFYRLFRTP